MLWITTQDGNCLINPKEITVNGNKIEAVMSSVSLSVWGKELGSYESNERAQEILNKIFMKIEVSNGLNVTYKMPKQ